MATELPDNDDRFEVVRLLGSGASSKVYHVKDWQRGGADRALKVLQSADALDSRGRERFIKEILTLSTIEHKNLVTAYEVVKFHEKDAYTMELVEGDTLEVYLRSFAAGRMSVAEIDCIMRQLLLAVDQLHRRGVIHRDIKLENVMLRQDNLIKLNDLGLVKIIGDDPKTDPGILLGTAYYMPPEYIMNKDVDHRMDIYACGMILWELLSAQRRFAGVQGEQVLRDLVASNFHHPMPDLSGERVKYRRILQMSLAVDPEERFSTAREMIQGLDGIFPAQPPKFFSVNMRGPLLIILIAVLAAVFTIFLLI